MSVAFPLTRRWYRRSLRNQLSNPRTPAVGADPEVFAQQAEQYGNPVTIARGLVLASADTSRPDQLMRATELLLSVVDSPNPDLRIEAYSGALDLVGAMDVKARGTDDVTGYAEAIQVLQKAAARLAPHPDTSAHVWFATAEYLLAAADDTDEEDSMRITEEAVDHLRRAVGAVTGVGVRELPRLHGMYAVLAEATGEITIDEAVAVCREGRRLAEFSPYRRSFSEITLTILLIDRAREGGPGARADLAEAIGLSRRLIRRPLPHIRLEAWENLVGAMIVTNDLAPGSFPLADVADVWRSAHRECLTGTPAGMIRGCLAWADWAESVRHPVVCAEAYRALIATVPSASQKRYSRAAKERMLADVQLRAEEAGWWLLGVGDVPGAATALELGRAVSLNEATARTDPAMETALLRAGRTELVERHRAAAQELPWAESGRDCRARCPIYSSATCSVLAWRTRRSVRRSRRPAWCRPPATSSTSPRSSPPRIEGRWCISRPRTTAGTP